MDFKLYNTYNDLAINSYIQLVHIAKDLDEHFRQTNEMKTMLIFERVKSLRRIHDIVNCKLSHIFDLCDLLKLVNNKKVEKQIVKKINGEVDSLNFLFGRDGFFDWLETTNMYDSKVRLLAEQYIDLYKLALRCVNDGGCHKIASVKEKRCIDMEKPEC